METLAETPDWIRDAIARHEGPLLRYAARIVRDPEQARDVVQDTFVRLFQADEAVVGARLPEWLFTVCRNRALDVVRKETRHHRLNAAAPPRPAGLTPAEHAEHRELLRRTLEAVDRLPEKQGRVLRLKLEEGLSYDAIAARTGLTRSYVGYLLHHAIKAVRLEVNDA